MFTGIMFQKTTKPALFKKKRKGFKIFALVKIIALQTCIQKTKVPLQGEKNVVKETAAHDHCW